MTRLIHDYRLIKIARMQVETVKDVYPDAEINTSYFDFHNDVCPRCQKKMKVYSNSIKGLGTASIFVVPEKQMAVLYACCNACSKQIARESKYGKVPVIGSDVALKTEDYINTKLGL